MPSTTSPPTFPFPSTPARPSPPVFSFSSTLETSSAPNLIDFNYPGLPGAFPTEAPTFRYPSLPTFDARHANPRPQVPRRPFSDPQHTRTTRARHHTGSPTYRARRRPTSTPTSPNRRPDPTPLATDDALTPSSSSIPTPSQIHAALHRRLFEPIATPSPSLGIAYLFRDPTRPQLLKIGSSKAVHQRITDLERTCGMARLERINVPTEIAPITNYVRAERLAQDELLHARRPYACATCGQRHGEWYEVDEEVAVQTVQRWIRFLRREPYDARGRLKDIWRYLVLKRTSSLIDGEQLSYERRGVYWDYVVAPPSCVDYCGYWVQVVWPLVREWPWQVSTVFSWLVMFVAFQNVVSFLVLAVSVVCSCCRVSYCKPSWANPETGDTVSRG